MSKFKRSGKGGTPKISTASLPDIVFMLLFFFMVTTVMRETSMLVQIKVPEASEVRKLEKKSLVSYIYVGENSVFENNFNLTKGTPGRVKILIDIYAMKDSVIRSNVKAFGKSIKDSIRIRDSVFLEGENARSVIKMKAAAKDGGEV